MLSRISPEFVVGNILVVADKYKINTISVKEILEITKTLQDCANNTKTNIQFLMSLERLEQVFIKYENFFLYDPCSQTCCVAEGKTISDLQNRFCGYMPLATISFLRENMDCVCQTVFARRCAKK